MFDNVISKRNIPGFLVITLLPPFAKTLLDREKDIKGGTQCKAVSCM